MDDEPPALDETDIRRIEVARDKARSLGYLLHVTWLPKPLSGVPWIAHAARDIGDQYSPGRFVAVGPSAADAAEAGYHALERILSHGAPWPRR